MAKKTNAGKSKENDSRRQRTNLQIFGNISSNKKNKQGRITDGKPTGNPPE